MRWWVTVAGILIGGITVRVLIRSTRPPRRHRPTRPIRHRR